MIDKDTKELERALNPMKWDKELNDTWHKNIPDLQKAFDAIKDIVIKRAEVKMKYEIEIEGLPEGWEIEKCDIKGDISRNDASFKYINAVIRITKKQPRRIVLEETGEIRSNLKLNCYNYFYVDSEGFDKIKILREVKENDSSLTNEEPKLSLTVDECRNMSLSEINMKIVDFLRDK